MVIEQLKACEGQFQEGKACWIEMGVKQCMKAEDLHQESTKEGPWAKSRPAPDFCAAHELRMAFIFLND